MRVLVGLVLLTAFAFSQVDRELEEFIEENQHLIPTDTKERLLRDRRQSQHWCCKEDVTKPINVQQTRMVHGYKEGYYMVKTGTTGCGTFGWSRCSLYGTRTIQVSFTYITQYDLDLDKECASHQLTCCKGYVQLNKDGGNNCIKLGSGDKEQLELIAKMKGFEGLLGKKK